MRSVCRVRTRSNASSAWWFTVPRQSINGQERYIGAFGGPVAVCLEIAKRPLVHALQRYQFIVLFPVNPATLAKYREAFVPSRAKDDPTDAEIALELLLRHREKLQALKPQSAPMRALTTLVEQRRNLIGDKTRTTNRLCSTLKEYFPQTLDWFEDRDTVLFCDFLQRWPSLKHVKRARQATLRSFFCAHNMRRAELIEERIRGIRCARALTDDVAVPSRCHFQVLSDTYYH